MFVDEVDIHIFAGSGGNGCLSFRREKFVPRGGPDGGDGGAGGSVYVTAIATKNTLVDFRFHPDFKARSGQHGQGSNRTGQTAPDLDVTVPIGTLVYEKSDGDVRLLADLAEEGQRVLVARGGRGGRGNARFVSSTNRAPRRTEPGEAGEEKFLRLELKLLADVGLIGFPNAGKSTLISRISAARPKIANYPFTTLAPNLGVVSLSDDRSFVVADVPGLIKGAHEGHGLGDRFLRHVERTKVLVHLVDVSGASGRDPVEDFDTIQEELRLFDPQVGRQAADRGGQQDRCARRSGRARAPDPARAKRKLPIIPISGVTRRRTPGVAGSGLARDRPRAHLAWTWMTRRPRPGGDRLDHTVAHATRCMTTARRIGVLGGTFDPIHFGHLDAAEAARTALQLDDIRLLPAHDPPHRSASPLASAFHRFALVALAIQDRPAYRVSEMELARSGHSYTADSLRAMHAEGWTPLQIFFILGADAFAEISTWREFPTVLDGAHFVVIARPGTSLDAAADAHTGTCATRLHRLGDAMPQDGKTRIILVEARTRDISSTMIRARLNARQPIDDLVPDAVARHIVDHHLYGAVGDLHGNRLRRAKPKRVVRARRRKPRLPKDVAAAVTAVCDKKAEDVVVLDLRKTGGFTDYFVICTGANARQMTAIADSVQDTLRQSLDERPALAEGVDKSEWILLDYFNFVVHIFSRECRAFYGLERLWGNAERHEITDEKH